MLHFSIVLLVKLVITIFRTIHVMGDINSSPKDWEPFKNYNRGGGGVFLRYVELGGGGGKK